jgi:hypothetical protein
VATRSVKTQKQTAAPVGSSGTAPAPAPSQAPSGPPRWTFGLAGIVGAVALGWQIVSHFIPKAEAPKPAPASPAPAPAPLASAPSRVPTPAPGPISVSATGPGGVAIGQMSGGSVQAGVSAVPQAAASPASPAAAGSRP